MRVARSGNASDIRADHVVVAVSALHRGCNGELNIALASNQWCRDLIGTYHMYMGGPWVCFDDLGDSDTRRGGASV